MNKNTVADNFEHYAYMGNESTYEESDFAPSFNNKFLVFYTGRDLETTSRSSTPYLNLYKTTMPGTLGASDIFMVEVHKDGNYGIPQNLGSKINTESKETFPFISDSVVLYFASDGHPGLGGLDIFSIDLKNQGKVKNLGNPINSPNDDFSLIFDDETSSGFFASNRTGGIGGDDIYALKTIDCIVSISGNAVDKDSEKPLPFATINAKNISGGNIGEAQTDAQGNYTIEIPCQES